MALLVNVTYELDGKFQAASSWPSNYRAAHLYDHSVAVINAAKFQLNVLRIVSPKSSNNLLQVNFIYFSAMTIVHLIVVAQKSQAPYRMLGELVL